MQLKRNVRIFSRVMPGGLKLDLIKSALFNPLTRDLIKLHRLAP